MAAVDLRKVSTELPDVRPLCLVRMRCAVRAGIDVPNESINRDVWNQRDAADETACEIRRETETGSCRVGWVQKARALGNVQKDAAEVSLQEGSTGESVRIPKSNSVSVGDLKVIEARESAGTRHWLSELTPASENVVIGRELMIETTVKLILPDNGPGGIDCVKRGGRAGRAVGAGEQRCGIRNHIRVEHVRRYLVTGRPGRLNSIRIWRGFTSRIAQERRIGEAGWTSCICDDAIGVIDLSSKGHTTHRSQVASQLRGRRHAE